MRSPLGSCSAFLALALWPAIARALVISEIHYNPPGEDDALEFIEIASDSTTPEDISGYRFVEGIVFEFPAGTVLGKGGFIVVAADIEALRARYAIDNVVGDFAGRLDSGGERISIANQAGIVVESVRFRDDGKWPVGPDGTGHTLVLRDIHLDSGEPESWTQSPELGGSPGRPNFPQEAPSFVDEVFVDRGETWRFKRGTEAFSSPSSAWRQPDFDDSGWEAGPTGIGYGDGDDATILDDMQNSYVSVACRKRFQLSAANLSSPGDLYLAVDYDDGFCAYLNGSEIARVNTGEVGTETPWDAMATGAREAGAEELFAIPRQLFEEGDNVLAITGFNFSIGSSDFSLIPRLLLRRQLSGNQEDELSVFFNELYRGAASGWVELHGSGARDIDLSGFALTDDPDLPSQYALPAGSVLPAGGFLVVDASAAALDLSRPEVRLFLLDLEGIVRAAAVFARAGPPGLPTGGYSEARFPDGGPLDWITRTPTRGAPNEVEAVTEIVINEIFYHPPEDRAGEFLEVHNRGSRAIDLSGFRFTKGIDYTFEAGTTLEPGGYLVLAEDPDLLLLNQGYAEALGPYQGRLADGGENIRLVDSWGNPVDEVRYHDGGRWSQWADGRGSSLELIDPFQDNAFASAWEASLEGEKAGWEELSFSVTDYVPAAESELHLFLVERGACLIDDVSIRRGGGTNIVPNPGFETSTSPWRIEGTHVHSRRITYDAHSGGACLELSASGKGDTTVNRIETDTSPAMTAGAYDVSLWARWLRGSSLLIAHGEFTPGPHGGRPSPATNLSGNTLAGRLRLTVPLDLGTPGAENSVTRRLREETGSVNLGPVIEGVENSLPSPLPGQAVSITARVADSDGVASVRALYREGSAGGAFDSVDLFDDGLHSDGAAGDGRFGGHIPGFQSGRKVVFYIEATDMEGNVRRFPADAPGTTCLFLVRGSLDQPIDTVRLALDDARTAELASRPLHSNDLLDGAVVFDNEEVYYNVGTRYRGSPWGRPGRNSFRIRFPEDDRYHRGRVAVNLSSRGSSAVEGAAYFFTGRHGTPATPVPTAEYFYIRTFVNGSSLGVQGLIQPVDGDYIERWYGETVEGPVLKAVGRLAFNDAGERTGWDGASFVHMGEITENYRGYYFQSMEQTRDSWEPFFELTRIMDRRVTGNAGFDQQIDSILDVEQFLRMVSIRALTADWDAFTVGNGHNGYLVYDSRDGRWELLPFDMDNSMQSSTGTIFPAADGDVARLMARPGPRRIYYRVIWELLQGYWSAETAGPFLDAVQRDTGVSTGGVKSFLTSRASVVSSQIQSFTTAPFRIVTNGGGSITTDAADITVEGEAPVQIASIFYQRGEDDPAPLDATWTSPSRWIADLQLPDADNAFDFLGFDGKGDLFASTSIDIHSTAHSGEPRVTAWFPSGGPAAGGFLVTFIGSRFAPDMRVFFGEVEATDIAVESSELLKVVAPPALLPLPPGNAVDVILVLADGASVVVPGAIAYEIEDGFVRGDSNSDLSVDLSDAVATLLHLFRGRSLSCADAADFDDTGSIEITDAVATLDFLFRGGSPPASPFPLPGPDPTDDGLGCESL